MASHKSAIKKMRHDRARRVRNKTHISKLRTELKKVRASLAGGDAAVAMKHLRETESLLDHSASLGIIHKNAASRTKSRLARQAAAIRA